MSRIQLLLLACSLSLLAPVAAFAGGRHKLPDIEPGRWETTSEQTVDGVRQPAQTHESCYKPEEVEKLLGQVEKLAGDLCQLDLDVEGDVATVKVDCTPSEGISVKGSGKTRFTRKSFSGTMKMTSRIDMPNMKKRQKIEVVSRGRWLGACK